VGTIRRTEEGRGLREKKEKNLQEDGRDIKKVAQEGHRRWWQLLESKYFSPPSYQAHYSISTQ
jgi:hypothetical protein